MILEDLVAALWKHAESVRVGNPCLHICRDSTSVWTPTRYMYRADIFRGRDDSDPSLARTPKLRYDTRGQEGIGGVGCSFEARGFAVGDLVRSLPPLKHHAADPAVATTTVA